VSGALQASRHISQVPFCDDRRHSAGGFGRFEDRSADIGIPGGLREVFDPFLEVASSSGFAFLQLGDLGVEALQLVDRVHQSIMYLRGMCLNSSQATADISIAEEIPWNGNQAVTHQVDGKHKTPDVGCSHDDTLDGAEIKTIGDDDVYQSDCCTPQDGQLVASVGAEGVYDAGLGFTISGVDIFAEKRKDSPEYTNISSVSLE
jgi:hypothetical protein